MRVFKSVTLVLAMLLGAAALQPSLAKTQHARRAAVKGVHASAAAQKSAKDVKPSDAEASDAGSAGEHPRRAGNKARVQSLTAKRATPSAEKRATVHPPSETRNSIGVAVPQESATTAKEEIVRPAPPAISIPGATPAHGAIARPAITMKPPDNEKIDGTALIRPSLATTGIGGPARFVAGINGTTIRQKH